MNFSDAGRLVTLAAGASPQAVLQGESACPCVVSVFLSRRDAVSNAEPTTTDVSIYADVEVGLGGVRELFSIDWRESATFTVLANTVTVNGRYATRANGRATPEQAVMAAAAVGTRASSARCTFTQRYGLVGSGTTVAFPVPRRAVDVSLLTTTATGYGDYTLQIWLAAQGNVLARIQPSSASEHIPLPASARAVAITNGRAGPDQLTLVYGLDL